MDLFRIALALATLLCSLVAGFLFAFTVVVMPGIKSLNNHDFLQSFKVMDGVIQNNQPAFILVWLGSVLTLGAAAITGVIHQDGLTRLIILFAFVTYLIGVQLPTITINVPLNNQIQSLDLDSISELEIAEARTKFETRWIRWNTVRTIIAVLVTFVLILLIQWSVWKFQH